MKRLRGIELVGIILIAVIAALAVFANPPEEIRIQSSDGRVRLEGRAPRDLGPFTIEKNEARGSAPHTAVVGGIYDISPSLVLLPLPVRLTFTYNPDELGSGNPLDLVIARFDVSRDRWEPVPGTVDLLRESVTANVRTLSEWALLVREDFIAPPELETSAWELLLENRPPNVVGYTVDLEYATVPNDFVLYRPAHIRDGCRGFFEGEEEKVTSDIVIIEETTYRIRITWELGDQDRCVREIPLLDAVIEELSPSLTAPTRPAPTPPIVPCNPPPGDGDCPPPGPPPPPITWEICDGIDNDNDGEIDEGWDSDNDGLVDCHDNCAPVANPDQKDSDLDGVGDVCEP